MSEKFKVGDKVIIYSNGFRPSAQITVITKQYKNGNLVTDCSKTQYSENGMSRESGAWATSGTYLHHDTPENREKLIRPIMIEDRLRRIENVINSADRPAITLESAERILYILKRDIGRAEAAGKE